LALESSLRPGNIVVVEAKDDFRGKKLAIVLGPQKWCGEGIPVYLSDDRMRLRYICIQKSRGDTIKKATK